LHHFTILQQEAGPIKQALLSFRLTAW